MYADHVPIINGAMRADVATFKRGVMFAILSMRVTFNRMTQQVRELERRGARASVLWGHKFQAWSYLEEHADALHAAACGARSPEACIAALVTIPGLGIVKAAFVAQMLGHDVACIDARNVARLGLPERQWRSDGERHKRSLAFKRKISRYVDHTRGRAEELWNDWCADAAQAYGYTAEEVSKLHLTLIVPRGKRHLYQAPTRDTQAPF